MNVHPMQMLFNKEVEKVKTVCCLLNNKTLQACHVGCATNCLWMIMECRRHAPRLCAHKNDDQNSQNYSAPCWATILQCDTMRPIDVSEISAHRSRHKTTFRQWNWQIKAPTTESLDRENETITIIIRGYCAFNGMPLFYLTCSQPGWPT